MRNLSGKDLVWLRGGIGLWENPVAMLRDIRKVALRVGPRYWAWEYAWGLVEETVHSLWSTAKAEWGVRAPLRRPAAGGDPC
jgi:hypothetical protein